MDPRQSRDLPPVIGFVGPSGSGKTTLIRELVPLLKARGLRVGYLKHAHHRFDLDRPGKDSYEIREAGAQQTLLASARRWALQVENAGPERDPDLWEMLRRFLPGTLDLVIAEGFKHADYPKIEVHRGEIGETPLYPLDPSILAVASENALPVPLGLTLLPLNEPETVATFVADWLAPTPEARAGRAEAAQQEEAPSLVQGLGFQPSDGC